jgi:signal transduction histidine kinase
LGSNVPLPENLSPETDTDSSDEPVELQEFIAELNKERYELGDVFDPVRSLVEGDRPLVSRQVYEQLRARKARVVSSVSFVEAKHPWAFFAIAGTEWGAPRWVYLDNPQATPITDLEQISQKLRENLDITAEDRQELDNKAATLLKTFLKRLKQTEEQLLPKKKQRALKQMRQVLKKYKDEAATKGESERERLVMDLLSLTEMDFGKQPVDLSILAERWLDLIRPLWIERLKEPRRKPLRLGDIDQDLIKKPIKTEDLREALDVPKVKPLDERIVAAIVGVQ